MATSGTTAFAPDFTEIAEEAWERVGREMRTGYDLRTARRSANLLTIEWANRGINMWTIDEGSVAMVSGTATYTLPTDTIDVLEVALRTGDGDVSTQSDLNMSRISVSTYASIPNKLTPGRPTQFYVNRLVDAPDITLWPVPNDSTHVLKYWRMRRIEDSGTGVNTPDINFRFTPALIAGLAYYLSQKEPGMDPLRRAELQGEYERQFQLASEEDREKATVRLVPRVY
jgi:hypothetical protein